VVHTLELVTRFDRAQRVAAYCGLDPREDSSGETVRIGHIAKQGNRLQRHLLVEAAHRAVHGQGDPDLRNFYFRLLGRKKNAAVAVTAVARKLVLRLYRMLREEIDYTEFRRRGREARCARKPASPALLDGRVLGPSAGSGLAPEPGPAVFMSFHARIDE
jgi:hypothetical protein